MWPKHSVYQLFTTYVSQGQQKPVSKQPEINSKTQLSAEYYSHSVISTQVQTNVCGNMQKPASLTNTYTIY